MLVNAHQFPGPALWQGIMLILLLPLILGFSYKSGKYMTTALWVYVIIGIVLFVVIVRA